MKNKRMFILAVLGLPFAGLIMAAVSHKQVTSDRIARGQYLVVYGGCNDCHTPLQMTAQGPVPDMKRMLSGHPETLQLPPPELKEGPWFAKTAGMTAWAGPWGISYAPNLTPDVETGMGIWTEAMFISAMRTGRHMGSGREILPPMPWRNVGQLSDEDLKAVYAYLKSIPAIRNSVPRPSPPPGGAAFE
ncbi:MAG TPA: c-type cytochrome [Verrucomicrobiae bacterium]|nr:c-type cytochrome [Verrucomicrobiae bacterium]